MNYFKVLLAVSFFWFISEIVIGRITYVPAQASNNADRKSLRVLWFTIIPSITAGIFLGIYGVGFVAGVSLWVLPAGLVLIALGLIIRWSAVLTLRKFFTSNVQILSDHQLVKRGLYKFIRHPAYTGSLLSFLGLGLAFSSWVSFAVIFAPVLSAFLYRIRVEEDALRRAFGKEYESYRKKTKMLIPWIF